jgi:4-phospho-D-threonate 3-dehydrogenase / 4-phospho-D-erythronate 3-dehydrogenase
MPTSEKPVVAITLGEVSGVGPEIAVKAVAAGALFRHCRPLLIGSHRILQMARDRFAPGARLRPVRSLDEAAWEPGTACVIDVDNVPEASYADGRPNAVTGKAMIEYSEVAIRLCLDRKIHGAIGGPHSKKAAADAGIPFTGYPGFVGRMTGSPHPFLMLVAGKVRVTNTTLHVALRKAVDLITEALVLEAIRATHAALKTFGVADARIAVAGLNPHAGEEGMFGDEDARQVRPAVEAANQLGIQAVGPLPADSLFWRCTEGTYDAYVAMYHDQAHIPVKVLAFMSAAGVVIGVPINWATVDHGCASDIAWKGVADPGALIETVAVVSGRRM